MDERRRTFLKLLVFGGIVAVFGKALTGIFSLFENGGKTVTNFRNFRLIESGKQLGVYGNDGQEILVIDKEQ